MQGNDIKLSLGVIIGSILLVVAIVFVAQIFDTPDVVEVNQTVGDSRNVKGNSNAQHTIVEFSDFQCPSCKAAAPIMTRFMADYGDQVKLVYRHFPLPQHQNAKPTAYAAEAAGKQNKFWEAHDWLFENQSTWANEQVNAEYFFEKFGADLGLNKDQFVADYVAEEVRNAVNNDSDAANALGVNSTPTFFVNGEKISGVISYDDLKEKIGVTVAAPTQEPTSSAEPTTAQ